MTVAGRGSRRRSCPRTNTRMSFRRWSGASSASGTIGRLRRWAPGGTLRLPGGPYMMSGYVLFDAVRSGWTKRGIKCVAVVEQTGGVLIVAKSPANALIPLAALDATSGWLPDPIHEQPASAKLAGNREAVS